MNTRFFETKQYLRTSVDRAEVIFADKTGVTLKTTGVPTQKGEISSADLDRIDEKQMKVGKPVSGTARIDILSDDVLRVRYAQRDCVPENPTPMVIGEFDGAKKCEIERVKNSKGDTEKIIFTTEKAEVTVYLKPYHIDIVDLESGALVHVGEREKNNFHNWDAVNTGLCYAPVQKRPFAAENFSLTPDEGVYGFGEQFLKLNKVGQTIDLNQEDAAGIMTPRTYKGIPFYVTTNGYGVYFNHTSLMTFWVGSQTANNVQVVLDDNFLDYYIFTGSIKNIFRNYQQLTGKGALPPKWSFGLWQSKASYSSRGETLKIAENMRKNDFPCDVLHLDTNWFKRDWYCDLKFNKLRFAHPKSYFKKMRKMGVNVSLWQLPYIPEGSALFDKLKAVDGFVKNKNGEIYDIKICFVRGFKGIVGVIDFTNPQAVKVYLDAIKELFRLGAKAIKTDFGESAPIDGVYYDGTPGYQMHNLYPLLYNKAVFDATKEATGDGIVWARSGWAGSQRYPVHWGGDSSPYFEDMAPVLAGGLSFGLSGFQFWSQDIGGFLGKTGGELLVRWTQVGLFMSHCRIHGDGDREYYKFDAQTQQICKDFLHLRYKLMPYIYYSAKQAVAESVPMVRALVVDYQDDPTVWNISDEFLFGEDLLIAPILSAQNRRRVYLPHGMWTDWWTGERINGGRWLTVDVPLDKMPIYIREGALVPMGPVMQYVDERKTDEIKLLISPFESENTKHMDIPVNDSILPVEYTCKDGKHFVKYKKSDVAVTVQMLGGVQAEISEF